MTKHEEQISIHNDSSDMMTLLLVSVITATADNIQQQHRHHPSALQQTTQKTHWAKHTMRKPRNNSGRCCLIRRRHDSSEIHEFFYHSWFDTYFCILSMTQAARSTTTIPCFIISSANVTLGLVSILGKCNFHKNNGNSKTVITQAMQSDTNVTVNIQAFWHAEQPLLLLAPEVVCD